MNRRNHSLPASPKKKTDGPPWPKGQAAPPPSKLRLAAIGLEAEFELVVDGRKARPEDVFGSPRAFIRGPLMHRTGTSYHLPTGGAVYFDTGVIELATPVIEIEPGCAARAGRSLWEAILFVRRELDAWERRTGRDARLVGFSAHYNISFDGGRSADEGRGVEQLALLLAHILPVPVMLLAANPRSTGIGVRPRGERVEITADFTPSPALMIATATLITGIARAVMQWPSFSLEEMEKRGLPVLDGFEPMPHTSRKGWLARHDCFPRSPFTTPIDEAAWALRGEEEAASLRDVGIRIIRHFRRAVRRVSDPFTVRLINALLLGRAPTLLELPDRPSSYEDVGRLCYWDNLFSEKDLARSRYEQVLIRAINGQQLVLKGERFAPVGMQGWGAVVFLRLRDRTRHVFPIDALVEHLDDWTRGK